MFLLWRERTISFSIPRWKKKVSLLFEGNFRSCFHVIDVKESGTRWKLFLEEGTGASH